MIFREKGIVVLTIFFITACSSSNPDNSVDTSSESAKIRLNSAAFEDEALYQCVTNSGARYFEDIIDLDCSSPINSFKGLEKANNLQSISISVFGNDISSLAEVTSLQSISIYECDNTIAPNITNLRFLPNLVNFSIASDIFSDLDQFAEFSNLSSLTVEGGCKGPSIVSDLSVIPLIQNLEYFKLDSYMVSDLMPLKDAMKLTTLELSIDNGILVSNGNPIVSSLSDINPLASLTNLKSLRLGSLGAIDKITDISALSSLVNLETLVLINLPMTDITALSSLVSLKSLALTGAIEVTDLSPIENLLMLEELSISGNMLVTNERAKFINIDALTGLPNLRILNLSDTLITDFSPLSNLGSLESFRSRYNNISNISFVTDLNNLKYLEFSYNNIEDISPIANLTNLTGLNFTGNNISDISTISNLNNLDNLELNNNNLTDISVFYSFEPGQLKIVYLSGNVNINCVQVNELKEMNILPAGLSLRGLCVN